MKNAGLVGSGIALFLIGILVVLTVLFSSGCGSDVKRTKGVVKSTTTIAVGALEFSAPKKRQRLEILLTSGRTIHFETPTIQQEVDAEKEKDTKKEEKPEAKEKEDDSFNEKDAVVVSLFNDRPVAVEKSK